MIRYDSKPAPVSLGVFPHKFRKMLLCALVFVFSPREEAIHPCTVVAKKLGKGEIRLTCDVTHSIATHSRTAATDLGEELACL